MPGAGCRTLLARRQLRLTARGKLAFLLAVMESFKARDGRIKAWSRSHAVGFRSVPLLTASWSNQDVNQPEAPREIIGAALEENRQALTHSVFSRIGATPVSVSSRG